MESSCLKATARVGCSKGTDGCPYPPVPLFPLILSHFPSAHESVPQSHPEALLKCRFQNPRNPHTGSRGSKRGPGICELQLGEGTGGQVVQAGCTDCDLALRGVGQAREACSQGMSTPDLRLQRVPWLLSRGDSRGKSRTYHYY